ncbi:unnamed protein product [Dibothriocephalus latus]|uniref:GAR domain-containing protein n=1 Tax=Dibothriocephalus latus TaxID=60516 RepID=A0A3P7LQS8_DIBLA|nr:unnamed protein product [Dibothriocephalus latus]
MAEDLAEWMSHAFPDVVGDLKGENFFDKISDGTLLCHLATQVHNRMTESSSDATQSDKPRLHGGFPTQSSSRRRIWYREIVCTASLSEVARLGGKFGMEVPEIVKLEKQIDIELAAEHPGVPKRGEQAKLKNRSPLTRMPSVAEMVENIMAECTCNPRFSMVRLSNGRYRLADKNKPIFVRLLRGHAMVRVDGGWDTLAHFLQEYDTCRKGKPEACPAGQSTAHCTTDPLQLEPPKGFKPQVLDPEPADLKPTPTAYLADLSKNRAILQDEDSFKVRTY